MSGKTFLRNWVICLAAAATVFGCQSTNLETSTDASEETALGSFPDAATLAATRIEIPALAVAPSTVSVPLAPPKTPARTNTNLYTSTDEDVFMTLDQATYLEVLPPYSTSETIDTKDLLSLQPLWPTMGRVTSLFGKRTLMRKTRMHTGMDIAGPRGTKIQAVAEGQVVFAGRKKGYGNMVIVAHDDVHQTLYAHLDKITVREGQFVRQSQDLGLMGRTGRSTGSHLHFEVRVNGVAKNPVAFLPKGSSGKVMVGQQTPPVVEQRAYYRSLGADSQFAALPATNSGKSLTK